MRSFAWVVGFTVLTLVLAAARWAPPPDPLIREAQRSLSEQRLYSGPINGLYDRDTAAAIRRFQMLHEMTATGRLDRITSSRMRLPEYTPTPSTAVIEEDREFLRSLKPLEPSPPPVAEEPKAMPSTSDQE